MEKVNAPASRLLALLDLLQSRAQVSGSEVAEELGVGRRTVRRYMSQLEALGIPITTARGPDGGYSLVAGYKLPPMMFSNDEVLALALGLAAVRNLGPSQVLRAAESAREKLERVTPAPVRRRLRAIVESVATPHFPSNAAGTAYLPLLSVCASSGKGVYLSYRDRAGLETGRDFDPYGLTLYGRDWYVAGHCHLRRDMRSFRLDRISQVIEQERKFARPEKFDASAYLAESLAVLPRTHSIEVRLYAEMKAIREQISPAIGRLENEGGSVLMRSQADDLDWLACELARLPWRMEVVKPKGLREALRKHARKLLAAAKS